MKQIVEPEYPLAARVQNLEGTVSVTVSIGPDGKVINAAGSGASYLLIKAATENARQWLFGPFPPVCEFPITHNIQYVYKLEGQPQAVAITPVLRTFLPDKVEIRAAPLGSDYPPIQEKTQVPGTK
ncbi:MAG TPA: energy transducer TonB [Candidatus Angelobacter sp.]|nr:energy transducer TonB [Candidatus Angelobacter sp.]